MITLDIITVHLNDFDGLELTFHSLKTALQRPCVSWLLIDGNSTAASPQQQKIIKRVSPHATQYVSEQDTGTYNAMNKGTRLAHGDYVLYLNAGDELHPEFSMEGIEAELEESRPGMVWGTCHERFPDGSLVKMKNRSPRLAWYGIPVNHQNVLFHNDILGSDPYDESYRYCADYDLISRLLNQNVQIHRTAMPIAIFQRGGASAKNFLATMEEEHSLRIEHFGLNRFVSKGISYLKRFNGKLGSIPAIRRILRKWV